MSLLPCRECKNQISTQATACPTCGCPVTELSVQTVEGTSKELKKQTLLSVIMVLGSMLALLIWAGSGAENDTGGLWGLMMVGGACWFLVTKIRIWWNHA